MAQERPGRSLWGRRRGGRRVALLLLLVLLGAAIALWWWRRAPEPVPAEPPLGVPETREPLAPAGEAPAEPEPPAAASGEPSEPLPALDASDAWVRERARPLSPRRAWGTWLATDDLVRRFVASVDNVADGLSPRAHLEFLAPRERFRVRTRDDGTVVTHPRSFARYDGIAKVVASLDAARCLSLYRSARTLLDAAFRSLGQPDTSFDDRVGEALRLLLATPVPTGEETLVQPSVHWEYADPALEALPAAQKHLLRMGPENVRRVQAKLRELTDGLGVAPGAG